MIDRLAATRTRNAAQELSRLLLDGQPDTITDHALAAMAQTPSRHYLTLLSHFTRHRRAEARRLAYAALAALPRGEADTLIADGLRDSDVGVRAVCARTLGERGDRASLDLLFRALARGVPEAATAIGKRGDATDVERFHQYLERLPLAVMLAGYARFLTRPEREIDLSTKLDIVGRLGEVAVPAVKHFLAQLLEDNPWPDQPRLRLAIGETARRIADQPARAARSPKPVRP